MKVLAIGAHFDDVELGAGGALINHREAGDSITIFVATQSGYNGADGRPVRSNDQARAEGMAAARFLGAELVEAGFPTFNLPADDGLVLKIRAHIEQHPPGLVYTHWADDAHPDHQAVAKATLAAARHLPGILMYRSNRYQSHGIFDGRLLADISRVFPQKLELIRMFASEYGRAGAGWEEDLRHDHATNGRLIGVALAEAFQPVRYLMRF